MTMQTRLLVLIALRSVFFFAGCANEQPAPKNEDRFGASAGVSFSSHDMSRVAPTRANTMPPN
jgi:hypothetical protein